MAGSNSAAGPAAATASSSSKLAVRASKRKSRAKPKPFVKQLVAQDELNFRDLVLQFTGARAPPSRPEQSFSPPGSASSPDYSDTPSLYAGDLQHRCMESSVSGSGCSCARPGAFGGERVGLSHNDTVLATAYIAQSLKTLETISAYLLNSSSSAHPCRPSCTSQARHESPNSLPADGMVFGDNIDILQPPPSAVAIQPKIRQLEEIVQGSSSATNLAKILQTRSGNGSPNELNTFLSLSCLMLLNQIASKSAEEGLR